MEPIKYIDRTTGETKEERIYFGGLIRMLYGPSLFGKAVLGLIARSAFVSRLCGWWQNLPITKRNIRPFIQQYQIDTDEFLEPVSNFRSFNDFFIRKLKPEARPIAKGKDVAIIPADGRYLVFPNIASADGFLIKGKTFRLDALLQDQQLADKYEQGTMVIGRLCPTDYHRFHFPIDCTPGDTQLINGPLHSVNPIAIKQNIHILAENKRTLCPLTSEDFGDVMFIEVGATCVGNITQTYAPHQPHSKGNEKGYFSFGGSTIILLFEPHRLILDNDLLEASSKKIEILCSMGQRLGNV